MTKRFKLGALVAALLVFLAVAPVMAAPPLALHIEVPATLNPDPDPFTASGAAVDAGRVCPTGTATDLSTVVTSPAPGKLNLLRVLKRFECDDASGTFDIKLVVRLDLTTHATTASWNIVGGTGNYAGLHGSGKLVGTPIVPGVSIEDVYNGKVH